MSVLTTVDRANIARSARAAWKSGTNLLDTVETVSYRSGNERQHYTCMLIPAFPRASQQQSTFPIPGNHSRFKNTDRCATGSLQVPF